MGLCKNSNRKNSLFIAIIFGFTLVSSSGYLMAQTGGADKSSNTAEDWKAAYRAKNYAEALRILRPLAEQGNAEAQFTIGYMYDDGAGVEKNPVESIKWYRMAAEQGHQIAQNNIGVMYELGRGVPKDVNEAVKWYKKSAEQGYSLSQFNLGMRYEFGEGVPKNIAEAVQLYKKAAAQGHINAQYRLGYLYEKGEGVEKNYSEALIWYRNAAVMGMAEASKGVERLTERERKVRLVNQLTKGITAYRTGNYSEALRVLGPLAEEGIVKAQVTVGMMHENGQGTPVDVTTAYMWYLIAAVNTTDISLVKKQLDSLSDRITQQQFLEAQRRAKDWMARHPKKK